MSRVYYSNELLVMPKEKGMCYYATLKTLVLITGILPRMLIMQQ